MNYQEKILSSMLSTMSTGMQYSNYAIIKTMLDCFAIGRIEVELNSLSKTVPFNIESRKQMEKLEEDLNKILSKYPIVIDK